MLLWILVVGDFIGFTAGVRGLEPRFLGDGLRLLIVRTELGSVGFGDPMDHDDAQYDCPRLLAFRRYWAFRWLIVKLWGDGWNKSSEMFELKEESG